MAHESFILDGTTLCIRKDFVHGVRTQKDDAHSVSFYIFERRFIMAEYNEEELKMRGMAFDLAVPIAMMLNMFTVAEWEVLQARYGFSENDYPALKRTIDGMRDVNSFKELTANPLLKLAAMSNPPTEEKKEDDPLED